MTKGTKQIRALAERLAALLEQESAEHQAILSALIESVSLLQGDTADRRFLGINSQLKRLRERLDFLVKMARQDFLRKIQQQAHAVDAKESGGRLSAILAGLIERQTGSFRPFCETLLDQVMAAVGAERGFVLFYHPESTEAEVVAARNFLTTNPALEEYEFSRTLLREIFRHSKPLLLGDVSHDSAYAREASVEKFQIKSVLAAPLKQEERTIGALYLENNSRPIAFEPDDLDLLQCVARFMVFYLRHARLLPVLAEEKNRVFFNADRASKEIVGQDPAILQTLHTIAKIADSPAAVLIEGESGTGKELAARALHYQGKRKEHAFVPINCAAIPENLLESELFGYEKGAFTGAVERYIGRLEQGDGGTIFLDEVSELAYPLQAKLLRFLQSSEFERLGGKDTIRVDVRIVAATSRNLISLSREGKFQDALFYRLNVIPLIMPALRDRKKDIPLLIDHFLHHFGSVYGRELQVEAEVYDCLQEYPFPGNVRELENLIHRMVALAAGETLGVTDLPIEILQITGHRISLEQAPLYKVLQTPPRDLQDLRRRKETVLRLLGDQERELAQRTVQEAGGNVSEAAKRLGIHRVTLHKILRRNRT
jgi:Nif-specific regulatory protein